MLDHNFQESNVGKLEWSPTLLFHRCKIVLFVFAFGLKSEREKTQAPPNFGHDSQ